MQRGSYGKGIVLAVLLTLSVCPFTLAQSSFAWQRIEVLPVGTLIKVESSDSRTVCRFKSLEEQALICLVTTQTRNDRFSFDQARRH